MNKLFESFINLIFPPRCEVCRSDSQEILCSDCFSQVKFIKPHYGIYSVSTYDGVLRKALHRFKYNKRKKLAKPLGILLVKYLSRLPSFKVDDLDAIVPVPLHKKRLKQRGFNHANLLAQTVGKYFDLPMINVLNRTRETKRQFDLARPERFTNVAGAFEVTDRAAVKNRRLLLLDDIYTTGATIAECVGALKNAGTKRVEVLTLSRAIEG